MGFYAAKLLWLCFPPLNVTVLALALGIFTYDRWPRAGRFFISASFFFFLLFGVAPTGTMALRILETAYPQPLAMPANADGILILGGAINTEISVARKTPSFYESAERVTEGLRLKRIYPGATLLFSGGAGGLGDAASEADLFRAYLKHEAFPEKNVLFERESRNTFENIVNSKALARPKANSVWIVVTSAAHMPRTIALMRSQGWPGTIIPYPVDFQTTGTDSDLIPSPDLLGNFAAATQAMREWLALVTYRIGGKTDSLL